MTSFVHVDHPTEHPGVVRAERAARTLRHAARSVDGPRGAASLVLAAMVAALLVLANEMAGALTDGHLLAAWMVMWTVAFAALALFAQPARRATLGLRAALQRWKAARRQAASDEKVWQVALTDARVMADISRAMGSGAGRDVRGYY